MVCWKVTLRIVTQVEFAFSPSPTSPLPTHPQKYGFPDFPNFLHRSGQPSPPIIWILLCASHRAARLSQAVPIWLNASVIFSAAFHFYRGFLEIKLRTKELITLNISGPLEYNTRHAKVRQGSLSSGKHTAYQSPSPLRSAPAPQAQPWAKESAEFSFLHARPPYIVWQGTTCTPAHSSPDPTVPKSPLSRPRAQATVNQGRVSYLLKPLYSKGNTQCHKSSLAMETAL